MGREVTLVVVYAKPCLIYIFQVLIKYSSHPMAKSPSRMTGRLFWVKWKWSIRSRNFSYNSREVRMTRLGMVLPVSLVRLGSVYPCTASQHFVCTSACWCSARTKRSPPRSWYSPHPDCRRIRSGVHDRGEPSRKHSRHDRVQQDTHRKPPQNRHDQSWQQNVCSSILCPVPASAD